MDSSRRAVEAYWRSRMIEGATSDEDKVTPVYKLEEICELLRSSHVSIVKEVSEYVLKRLDHKSPVVKQKALRLIKYSVGKSGVEFRREMQRNSAAVRQLFHYKGHPDPLKGDALNKAVRDTAHEALSAMFASEDSKPSPAEDLNRRIEGFGNTNYDMPSEDKKSFLSEVVGLGGASIIQGLSSIATGQSTRKNENGSYKGPVLRRSLTTETEGPDRYDRFDNHSETRSSSGFSKNVGGITWGQDPTTSVTETPNGASSLNYTGIKTREEKLLETIVTSGGVRLQPSRDAIQVFLAEAVKLDAVALSRALEVKLQSHLWQVRMKAVCVLESILRKKDDEHFGIVASYFSENRDTVMKCSESPQASLRDKALKVLSLLDGEQTAMARNISEKSSSVKPEMTAVSQMPDLIDTGDSDEINGKDDFVNMQSDATVASIMTSTTPVIDDLFGDSLVTGSSTGEHKNEEDPFADVSFHTGDDKEHVSDLFSGLTVDDKQSDNDIHLPANKNGQEVFDIFGSSIEPLPEPASNGKDMNDLLAGLSNEKVPNTKPQKMFPGVLPEVNTNLSSQPSHQVPNNASSGIFASQMAGMNQNAMFPLGSMPYNMPPNIMFNQAFASQPINYGAMGSFLAQQQLLATMTNYQHTGSLGAQAGISHEAGNMTGSPLPDIFNPNIQVQTHNATIVNPKKEETKAFDFISDHLSAVRDPKRVI